LEFAEAEQRELMPRDDAPVHTDKWRQSPGPTLRVEAKFPVNAVLHLGVCDRAPTRIATGEDRHFAQIMIFVPLDTPLAGVHPILKDNRWLCHIG
jgi:hypothetical protein